MDPWNTCTCVCVTSMCHKNIQLPVKDTANRVHRKTSSDVTYCTSLNEWQANPRHITWIPLTKKAKHPPVGRHRTNLMMTFHVYYLHYTPYHHNKTHCHGSQELGSGWRTQTKVTTVASCHKLHLPCTELYTYSQVQVSVERHCFCSFNTGQSHFIMQHVTDLCPQDSNWCMTISDSHKIVCFSLATQFILFHSNVNALQSFSSWKEYELPCIFSSPTNFLNDGNLM